MKRQRLFIANLDLRRFRIVHLDCSCLSPKRQRLFLAHYLDRNACSSRVMGFAGIDFIDESGGGPGVRLRKRQRAKKSKSTGLIF